MNLSGQWYSNWVYRKTITNNLACGGDLTNFPLLVVISNDSDLNSSASNNGYDITFTAGMSTNKLDHEIEYYSNGTLVAWVKIPYLSASIPESNIIHMYFDKTKPGNQQLSSNVWDSGYAAVWHLSEETGSIAVDSTSNTNDGIPKNNPNSVAGKTGNAINFVNAGTQWFDCGNDPVLNIIGTEITIECWIKYAGGVIPSGERRTIISKYNSDGWILSLFAGSPDYYRFWFDTGDCSYNTAPTTAWTHWVGTYNGSQVIQYIDGIKVTNRSKSDNILTSSSNLYIGRHVTGNTFFDGIIDELRLSSVARSSNWILTGYSNQYSPLAFRSLGALNEYGVPVIGISALSSPPVIVGQKAFFNITADTYQTGNITNIQINYGDNSLENFTVNSASITLPVSHIYLSDDTRLLMAIACSDSGKIRTNQIYITPAPYVMSSISSVEIIYLNEGLKLIWSFASTNHIRRAVVYRNSLQLASISPVSTDMEYLDRYLLYDTAYTYQIGTEYNIGMVLSSNIVSRPFRLELAQKTIGKNGGSIGNLFTQLEIPQGTLPENTLVRLVVSSNLLYNFNPGHVQAYNQVRIETEPPTSFASNAKLSLMVPFFNNKIRMVPDDGRYENIFTGSENRLTISTYSDNRAWIPVYSRVEDKNVLPNLNYKILSMDLTAAGTFGIGIILNNIEYENKVTVKNRVFAPESAYRAMSRVLIFFPNPSFEEVLLQIFNINGKKVYERYLGGSVSMISWDGMADSGKISDSGLYIAAITRGGRVKDTFKEKLYLLK
ncbi:MAG: hypothetical protein A2096_12055 [Spirochaetes bacterium GWF1_41_5]|nr:MAG: hypothetical protein A2096_12055 [Spirochaetes bacterium GWF1_41_5]